MAGSQTEPICQPTYVPLKREPVITFFGWASIAVGAYGLLGFARGMAQIVRSVMWYDVAVGSIPLAWLLQGLLYILIYTLLLMAGRRLLRKNRGARGTAIAAGACLCSVYVLTRLWFITMGWNPFQTASSFGGMVLLDARLLLHLGRALMNVLLDLLYPVALLIAMFTPAVRRALRRPLRCPDDPLECTPFQCDRYDTCERAAEAHAEARP